MDERLKKLKELIENADAIMIGAGAGLSSAAGFQYGGKAFLDNFPEMHEKYGYTDMYSAGFHDFLTLEEKWGYWAKYIYLNRYATGALPLYKKLYEIVKEKNYFVLTTNVDHQFQKAGFSKERLFYTQGDYGLFQCSVPCHQVTFDNEKMIKDMMTHTKDGFIPRDLVPRCPYCGAPLETNLRADDKFVEDEGWKAACQRYEDFINENKNKRILFLELGVGWNTPAIIKYPFIRMTYSLDNAFYVCINQGKNFIPDEIKEKALLIEEDIHILKEL